MIQRYDANKSDVYMISRDAVEYSSIPLLYFSEYIPVVSH